MACIYITSLQESLLHTINLDSKIRSKTGNSFTVLQERQAQYKRYCRTQAALKKSRFRRSFGIPDHQGNQMDARLEIYSGNGLLRFEGSVKKSSPTLNHKQANAQTNRVT